MININEIIKNFWQKGNAPVVLFSGSQATGTITLTQSWRPFRRLYVYWTNDTGNLGGCKEIDVAQLKYAVENKSIYSAYGYGIVDGANDYWLINLNTMTDTSWPTVQENSMIKRILGVY
jgi:hypothetical protein